MCTETVSKNDESFARFSSFNQLQHVIAFIHRFINNFKLKIQRLSIVNGSFDDNELQNALKSIIRIIQCHYFADLFKALRSTTKNVTPFY